MSEFQFSNTLLIDYYPNTYLNHPVAFFGMRKKILEAVLLIDPYI